ncbi:hypothetical protein ACFXA3_23985 [Streptomyces sp. NPDC059456]|uniref:hypothetical protein n=1 Tax=Streptomyces sp. NPDC059456 TaxID=3346838 RepID=UPI0036C2C7BD
MTDGLGNPERPSDQVWVRQVAGCLLVALHLLNAAVLWIVLSDGQPAGGDEDGRAATDLACLFSVCLSLAGTALTLAPTVRRALGRWWLAPPVVLGAIALTRLVTGS